MNTTPAATHTLARLPRFSTLDPSGLDARVSALLDDHRERLGALTATPQTATWDSVMAPLEVMDDALQQLFGPFSHLHGVADSAALRTVYDDCLAAITTYASDLAQHAGLAACYRHVREGGEYATLAPARQKVIDNALRDFRLGGSDLPPAAQARVKSLKVELARLATRFEENVLDATQAFRLNVTDAARLAGLPEGVMALARQNAERAGEPGWTLTLDFPCFQPAMAHLDDRELRHALYAAYATRASDAGPLAGSHDNGTVMREILTRRQALARGELAQEFDHRVGRRRHLGREREFGVVGITEFARERLRKARYELSQEDLRPYFPVTRVVDGMLEVAARVFGVRFERVDGIDTWHPEVSFHAVLDEQDSPLGFFYLDLYARERKRPGAWMDECLVRWQHDAVCQLPVAYLTCNFTPTVAGRPSLLSHDEVTTLFHEFGHGLHHMLTRIDRPAVAGINGVPWDAVELPSQFLENWCWERAALDLISAHHESGATLPDALFERLVATRRFQAAMQTLRQVEFALFDFRLHREFAADTDIQALLDDVRGEVAVITPPPWNRFQHSFAHIFAGGYAAGYYSYKWAEVLAADAFARFEEEGVFNPATGRAFRETILANGGADDAMALFKRFRGREPAIDALLRQAGLHA